MARTGAHWEDSASERQGDEVLEALGSYDVAEMRQIDAALARIEDGSYGYPRLLRQRDQRGTA